jgi:2-polyprenyl-3-methyl-5-hydroxy-6-metoxy-1,4-benzoquinol methylase
VRSFWLRKKNITIFISIKDVAFMIKDQMEKIYQSMPPEKIPWNMDSPPELLQSLCKTGKIRPCKAIELGCGLGNYAIYLAHQGYHVTGVDIADTAIKRARKAASQHGVSCRFMCADVLGSMVEIQDTFEFAFDWELLHHIYPADREKYIKNVHRLLNPQGYYLSVCFSEMSLQFGGVGKYRTTPLNTILYFSSEQEMRTLFSSLFEIDELRTIEIEGKAMRHKAIYALLKKK